VRGQDPEFNEGLRPFDSLHGGNIDSISMTNGSLSLHIPFWSFPQRGDKIKLDFFILYQPISYSVREQREAGYSWKVRGSRNGPYIDETQRIEVSSKFCTAFSPIGYTYYVAKTSAAASHQLANAGSFWESLDATGIRYYPSTGVAIDRQGIRFTGTYGFGSPLTKEDPNGNRIAFNYSSGYTDTLGRQIPRVAVGNGTSSFKVDGVATGDLSGCTGPRPTVEAKLWIIPAHGGGTTAIKFCLADVPIKTNLPGAHLIGHQYAGTIIMLQSILLPNGSTWTFEYDDREPSDPADVNYGNLTKITFPAGGTISYSWHLGGGFENPLRAVASRTVDANDGAGPSTWTYIWLIPDPDGPDPTQPFQNTITDPQGNQTVYTVNGLLVSKSYHETQVRFYQGSTSSGTLLKTISTDYLTATNPFYGCKAPRPMNVVPIRVTTSWPNGDPKP
jgi:hypothetical protein